MADAPRRPTLRLRVPEGTDELNYGETSIPINADGTADVPVDEVDTFVGVGGFSLADSNAGAPDPSLVPVKNPKDPTASVSFGGETYTANDMGVVFVPALAVTDLLSHGFVGID